MSVNNISVNLDCEADILMQKSAAKLVIAIIEYLLFQRNQIPFVFSTFKYLISKWNASPNEEEIGNYFIERQRELARSTLESIKALSNAILEEFDKQIILLVRVLFGSTVLTPKEAFIIKLPPITKDHFLENHKQSTDLLIKHALMTLLSSEELYKIFSGNLGATNMFIDFQIQGEGSESEHFFQKEFIELPPRCSTVIININNKTDVKSMDCCKEMKVFKDISSLTLDEDQHNDENHIDCEVTTYWEANCIVRGYKDVLVKGQSIWQS